MDLFESGNIREFNINMRELVSELLDFEESGFSHSPSKIEYFYLELGSLREMGIDF